MAVGETEEERKKASLSLTKRKVKKTSFRLQSVSFVSLSVVYIPQIYYIFETRNVLYRKIIRKIFQIGEVTPKINFSVTDKKRQEFRAKDKAIKDDIKVNLY